jgi:hypothetical protein
MQADVHRTKIAQTEHPVLVLQQVMPCGPRADQIVRFVTSTILFYDEHVIDQMQKAVQPSMQQFVATLVAS